MDHQQLFQAARPTFYLIITDADSFDDLFRRLRSEYADHDVNVWKIRGTKSSTREGFFDEIGAVLQFPHYFGENWDALRDIFYDMGWLPGTLLMIPAAEQLLAASDPQDFRNWVELMDTCNRFYLQPPYAASTTSDTGFHVLLQTTPARQALLEQRLQAAGAEFELVPPD